MSTELGASWLRCRAGYQPLYYSSAVLPDGRVIVEGGEYNMGHGAWTNKGAIYDPKTNTWTVDDATVRMGTDWRCAERCALPMEPICRLTVAITPPKAALLNPTTLTWTATGSGKFDVYDEEGINSVARRQSTGCRCLCVSRTTPTARTPNFTIPAPVPGRALVARLCSSGTRAVGQVVRPTR